MTGGGGGGGRDGKREMGVGEGPCTPTEQCDEGEDIVCSEKVFLDHSQHH